MQPVDAAAVSQQQVSCERVEQCTGARLDLQTNNNACSSIPATLDILLILSPVQ